MTAVLTGNRSDVGPGDRQLGDLLRRAVSTEDPDDALRAITTMRGELDRLERDAVACARVAGASWSAIADALSITRQAAQKRHRGMKAATPESAAATAGTVLVTAPARMAVRMGRQEARSMGSAVVGSEHLLLGILRSGDQRAARVLLDMGVTLEDARIAAQPTLIDGRGHAEPAGKDGISAYARSVLEQSLREAVALGEGHIGVDHLLLALLREEVGGAARTLHELGVDADAVRERLSGATRARRAMRPARS